MKELKIILTAVGCPGAITMIRALKKVKERNIHIIGCDINPTAPGRFFVDEFHIIPPGNSDEFIPRMIEIAEATKADVLLSQSSFEIIALAREKESLEKTGIRVMIGSEDMIVRAGDKWETYQALEGTAIPTPNPIIVKSLPEFNAALETLGYPENKVCFKPPFSKGSRGFRTLTGEANRLDILLNEKPDSMLMTKEEAVDILGSADTFPELIMMDFIPGKEYTVDAYCRDGEILCGFVKTREDIRAGLAMYFEMVDSPELWNYAKIIAKRLKLDYFVNIQFKGNVLLEINPRVSTFIHQDDFNMPYASIKHFLGEIDDEEIMAYGQKVNHSRRTVRYFDQVFYDIEEINQ